jgi:beta-glucosidase
MPAVPADPIRIDAALSRESPTAPRPTWSTLAHRIEGKIMTTTDDTASTQSTVDRLMALMTPAEKAGQLTQYFHFGSFATALAGADASVDPMAAAMAQLPEMVEATVKAGGSGSLLFVTKPAEVNRLQRLAVENTRLGIPLLFGFDVIHGLRTILPVPIAMAASWDPTMIEQGQEMAAREARAVGIHWTFAPMVDIARDPRWGRIIEGAGEDPYLAAAVAVAQVRGFQGGEQVAPEGVIAGPKHFAGYGAALGGRDNEEVNLSDSELWNVYLPPFKAAVDAGAGNVMTAYMDLNGVPATGNTWLFTEVLRNTWGFGGFVVSDANAVRSLVTHGFAANLTDAAARGINAGCDMEMAIFDPAYGHLVEAMESGAANAQAVDECVRRVLTAKVRLGLFDAPFVDEERAQQVLDDPAHREVARHAAERSAVLLRNDGGLLPLDASGVTSLAVIGLLADSRRDTLGPWVFDFDLNETVTVLEGIRNRVGAGIRVDYAAGVPTGGRVFASMFDRMDPPPSDPPDGFDEGAEFRRAVDVASAADVAIVVLGERQNMIGESASRSSLELPGRQLDLLQAVVATGTPVVLILMNGRPLDLRWAAENVPAILDVWYPGTRGGEATANLLFGDVSPGGKLPFTWPRSVGQVPMIYSHTQSHSPEDQGRRYWDEESTPLFPFGHGLSYGRFEYVNLIVDQASTTTDGTVHVSVDVTNTSDREADEVVQLYIHQRHGSASRPVRELKGFRRITVAAGGSTTVEFTVGPDERRYWSAAARDWVADASTFDVWVGGDSTATLAATFEVH